ncbi:MAG: hypothetical protein HY060_19585 [Proteobacteria bacterium]|nr:hypothetical protein [Pseudomonadota bacterium]
MFTSRKKATGAVAERRHAPRIALKRASAKVDSKTFPLANVSTTGFLLGAYEGDLIARQRVYLTLMIEVDGQPQDYLTDAVVVRLSDKSLAGRFGNLRRDARRAIERLMTKR